MMKRPILSAFVTAMVISVALAIVLPYSVQESPWGLFFILVLFPFIWFLAWLVINALAWWQDTMTSEERPADETRGPPQ
jgi:F0F1-type ATP synthase assembly protein I